MREIVGAAVGDRRQGAVDLRRPRARPLPAPDPADQAGRRLHRPAHDAVLLPGPAEHARRSAEINDPAGSGPYYVAERVVNQRIVLKRNPFYRGDRPANVDQIVWTIGESLEACLLAVEQDRIDFCVQPGLSETRLRGLGREVRHQPPRRAVLRQPRRSIPGSSPSTTTGPRSRARARSRSRRRSTTQSTGPRWSARSATSAGKRTDQMLPPELARPDEHLPARRAQTPPPRGNGSRGRGSSRDTLVLYADNTPAPVSRSAQMLAFNLKQIGIDLEVKYFRRPRRRRPRPAGSPSTSPWSAGSPTTPTRPTFFVPILTSRRRHGRQLRRPARQRGESRRRTA